MKRLLLGSLASIAILSIAACDRSASDQTVSKTGQETTAPAEPIIEPGDWDHLMGIVASHKGKVVVVDLWSSW